MELPHHGGEERDVSLSFHIARGRGTEQHVTWCLESRSSERWPDSPPSPCRVGRGSGLGVAGMVLPGCYGGLTEPLMGQGPEGQCEPLWANDKPTRSPLRGLWRDWSSSGQNRKLDKTKTSEVCGSMSVCVGLKPLFTGEFSILQNPA